MEAGMEELDMLRVDLLACCYSVGTDEARRKKVETDADRQVLH
jgi:hypothetical protein